MAVGGTDLDIWGDWLKFKIFNSMQSGVGAGLVSRTDFSSHDDRGGGVETKWKQYYKNNEKRLLELEVQSY